MPERNDYAAIAEKVSNWRKEGVPDKEIAERMGVSWPQMRNLVRKAKARGHAVLGQRAYGPKWKRIAHLAEQGASRDEIARETGIAPHRISWFLSYARNTAGTDAPFLRAQPTTALQEYERLRSKGAAPNLSTLGISLTRHPPGTLTVLLRGTKKNETLSDTVLRLALERLNDTKGR